MSTVSRNFEGVILTSSTRQTKDAKFNLRLGFQIILSGSAGWLDEILAGLWPGWVVARMKGAELLFAMRNKRFKDHAAKQGI